MRKPVLSPLLFVVVLVSTGQLGAQSVPATLVETLLQTPFTRGLASSLTRGGFRLNLYCMGSGEPTVVFDSGYEDWAPAWSAVQPQIAKRTRACSYDRAGAGFSVPGPMPRTSVRAS